MTSFFHHHATTRTGALMAAPCLSFALDLRPLQKQTSRLITPDTKAALRIIDKTAEVLGFAPELLTGPRGSNDLSRARSIAIALIRKNTNLTLVRIGELFGGRDSSSIVAACHRFTKAPQPWHGDAAAIMKALEPTPKNAQK